MGLHARHQFRITDDGHEFVGLHIGPQRAHGPLEESFLLGRRPLHIGLAKPVIGIGLASPHDGVGEDPLAGRHQAAHVVGMQMGDVDFIDLLRLVAGRLQVGQQLAQGGAKQAGRAHVHQHQFRARIDQVGIDGRFQRAVLERLGQRLVGFVLGHLEQGVHRQVEGTVVEDRYLEIAQHRAIKARGLEFGHGRGRQRRCGAENGGHGRGDGGHGRGGAFRRHHMFPL